MMNAVAKLRDQQVYIVPAPVVDIGKTIRIFIEGCFIINPLSGNLIGIEIIIKMNSINIISFYHI
ncbi:hypothetical protein D3C86_1756930 [compost metagenome]